MEQIKINCHYSNDKINEDEWNRIELQCKEQKHLAKNDKLRDIIESDEKTLESYGITFKQLKDFFKKIKYHFYHQMSNNVNYQINKNERKLLKTLKIDSNSFPYSWNYTKIFNGKLIIGFSIWDGAEICPFKSDLDKQYHGYEYGDTDWFFIKTDTNEVMHIGDLLFHQINTHHFFQSPESLYRADPAKIISFFSLKTGMDYITDFIISKKWCQEFCSSSFNGIGVHKIRKIEEYEMKKFETDTITHVKHDTNDIYYTDTSALLIINNKNTLPISIIIHDHIIPNEDFIDIDEYTTASIFYKLKNIKSISETERSKIWM